MAGTSASAASPGEGRAPRPSRSHRLREPQLPPGETSDFPRSPPPGPPPLTRLPPPSPPKSGDPRQPRKPRLVRTGSGRQGPVSRGPAAPSRPSKRGGLRAPTAKTPRILYRGKSGSSSKMGRQGLGGAGAAWRSMQRSQSGSSLSASFEALAGYFPCMNSLEEEGEAVVGGSACTSPVSGSRWLEGWQGWRTPGSSVPTLSSRVCGWGQRPPERRPAEEFCRWVVWSAPQAPTWEAVLLMELTSTVLESCMRMGWVAGWPYWVHPTWSCFHFLPPSWL